jgi:hypothetical protein
MIFIKHSAINDGYSIIQKDTTLPSSIVKLGIDVTSEPPTLYKTADSKK